MSMNKPHLEFHRVDMSNGWSTLPGYPPGIEPREPLGNPLLLLFHQRSHFSRLSLVRRPSVIRGAGILRCIQMKPTQKRPEPKNCCLDEFWATPRIFRPEVSVAIAA